jgi:hypothetical protein
MNGATPSMKRAKYAIIVFYVALFVGLALYDEKPVPGLVREMARTRPEIIEPGNAWIVFLGFASPKGVSPYACGERKMHELKQAMSTAKSYREFLAASIDGNKSDLRFQGKLPSFYSKKDDEMLPYAAKHGREIAAFSRDNEVLLQRYEALRACPRYNEPLDYGFLTPMPSFAPIRSAQKVKLLQLAFIASRGETTRALAGLREDAEFWRFVSRNSSTLISKLISFANLHIDLRFAAELGASRQLNESEMQVVQEILRPFAGDEASLVGTLRGEARFVQHGMELSYRQELKSWSPVNLLFKSRATRNRMFADYQEFIRLAGLSPQEFARNMKRQEAHKTTIRRIGLPLLYNPAGEFLAVIGQSTPGIQNYIEKGYNLEGLRRLACIKVLAHRQSVPPERMQRFLAAHVQDLGNPYTGKAMTWDATKGSISFKDLSGGKSTEMYL